MPHNKEYIYVDLKQKICKMGPKGKSEVIILSHTVA